MIDPGVHMSHMALFAPGVFQHPFALGLYVGFGFVLLVSYRYFKIKWELGRFRRHLSDRLELEADMTRKTRQELETLRKENESLRIKVNALNEAPDRKAVRDLEVFARAEKRLFMTVPGFAPAWETAKAEAAAELAEEEAGRSTPRRIFTRLFGGGDKAQLTSREPAREGGSKAGAGDGVGS